MISNANSHFSMLPSADISRSRFERPHKHLTTFSAGSLIPVYVSEILPGDTVTMDMSFLCRMATPIFPVMDDCYLDYFFFFCPTRILWDHYPEFLGENRDTAWTQPVEYNVPQIYSNLSSSNVSNWVKGTIADYFGIPTDIPNIHVNALPFRGYTKIWNEFFRDQNVMVPAYCPTDDTTVYAFPSGSGEYNPNNAYRGLFPLPVARFHDAFSSCLPQPQKGSPVEISIGEGSIPVGSLGTAHTALNSAPLHFDLSKINLPTSGSAELAVSSNGVVQAMGNAGSTTSSGDLYLTNLYADVSGLNLVSVNELRQAFAIQTMLEKDGRYGTRLRELLKSHFGVDNSDGRLQIPEYLGGRRVPINMAQVVQTSSTDSTSPQGNVSAFSCTSEADSVFTKSFTEHGYIIGLVCCRTMHTYQQGVDPMWKRERKYDFYWPELANLSDMPVYRESLYMTSDEEANKNVFGYQEPWWDYRYHPNRVSGAFRSNYAQSLDSWHYADYYDAPPVLNMAWMSESPVNIDRTLAVQSELEDQFIADFYFKADFVRPMPLYSVPGLNISHY